MPLPSIRPSLTVTLEERYTTQPAGGAFNAKNIIESGVDAIAASQQGAQFQNVNGFLTKVQQGVTDYKNSGEGLSQYENGLDTRKYDPSA